MWHKSQMALLSDIKVFTACWCVSSWLHIDNPIILHIIVNYIPFCVWMKKLSIFILWVDEKWVIVRSILSCIHVLSTIMDVKSDSYSFCVDEKWVTFRSILWCICMLSRFWMTSIQFNYLTKLKEKTLEVTLFYKRDKEVIFLGMLWNKFKKIYIWLKLITYFKYISKN
jgi:hypothetical protein